MQTDQFYRVETDTKTQPNEEEKPASGQPKKRMYVFIDAVSEEELLVGLGEQERADGGESAKREEDETTTRQEPLPWVSSKPVGTRKFSHILMLWVPPCLLAFLAMLAGSCVYLFFFQSVTVTITPDIRQITTTGSVTIVTAGAPDASQNQLPGRQLPALTMSQEQTVATTGITNQEARPGRGIVTFYNAALYSQTIAANTVLTGTDNVQITTEYAVTVPAAVATFGVATVTAHATQKGLAGNIKAGDISGNCCLEKIAAINSAFTGGQEAESYQSVAQSDIDTTAAHLKTLLTQSVTTALQTQVQPTETLVTPLQCSPTVATDHKEGEKATQVQVTVRESCTAVTYDSQAFTLLLHLMQTQAADNNLHKHYQLAGLVHTAIQSVAEGNMPGTYQLALQTTGTWVYAFSQRAQQHLAAQIAGMSTSQATHILLRTPGIRRVSFGSTVPALPTDPQHIHFFWLFNPAKGSVPASIGGNTQ